MEQNRILQERTRAARDGRENMPRDEQVITFPCPEHVYPNEACGYDNGMHPIYAHSIYSLQPSLGFAIFTCKPAVDSQLGNPTARFGAAQHVTLRQVLVLNGDRRIAIDAALLQPPQRNPWQPQSAKGQQFW